MLRVYGIPSKKKLIIHQSYISIKINILAKYSLIRTKLTQSDFKLIKNQLIFKSKYLVIIFFCLSN